MERLRRAEGCITVTTNMLSLRKGRSKADGKAKTNSISVNKRPSLVTMIQYGVAVRRLTRRQHSKAALP